MPYFFLICICHLEYVQYVGCKQKVHSVPEKQQRKTRWASVLRRMCAREKRRSRRNKWLQAHSARELVCIVCARVYPSFAFVWLNSFSPFFPQQVCVHVGQSSERSSRQAGRTGRLHGICTVTQKDVIRMPISGSTTEIVIATMSLHVEDWRNQVSLQYQVMLIKVICSRIMFYVTLWSSFTRIWP